MMKTWPIFASLTLINPYMDLVAALAVCPDGSQYSYYEAMGKCFSAQSSMLTWEDARSYCRTYTKSNLFKSPITVTSAERAHVLSIMELGRPYWIGARYCTGDIFKICANKYNDCGGGGCSTVLPDDSFLWDVNEPLLINNVDVRVVAIKMLDDNGDLVMRFRTKLKTENFAFICYHWLNPCDSNPCLNGGTCNQIDGKTYTCSCLFGYSGINCQVVPVCGDSTVNPGEECDDGNTVDGDGCQSDCKNPVLVCGDNIVDSGEQCDDGNTVDGDGCQSDCNNPVCGDNIVDPGEQCDDGNTVDGDGCQSDCSNPVCGDNIVDPGEQCDDGNTVDGDGCQSDCSNPVCGDNIVDPGEQCDDGNTVDGDGCHSDCTNQVESTGVSVTAAPPSLKLKALQYYKVRQTLEGSSMSHCALEKYLGGSCAEAEQQEHNGE